MLILIRMAPAAICIALLIVSGTIVDCLLRRRSLTHSQLISFFMTGVSTLGLMQEQSAGRTHGLDTLVIGGIGVILLVIYLRQPVSSPINRGKESAHERETSNN
ncbi:MAG: hypothetical protein RI947_1057 [Candidatus Parcubacteria bacterium]|jgi:hypothetical protein